MIQTPLIEISVELHNTLCCTVIQTPSLCAYKCSITQWTLLAFDGCLPSTVSTPEADGRAATNHSSCWQREATTHNAHILNSIRISPFPSPPIPNLEGSSLNPRAVIGGGRSGAFTPYRQVSKRQKSSPISVSFQIQYCTRNSSLVITTLPHPFLPCVCVCACVRVFTQSESSGAITDSITGSYQSPVLDTSSSTSITGEMPHLLRAAGKKDSPVSIVTFGQRRRVRNILASNELATTPSHEFEVGFMFIIGVLA